MNGNGLWRWIAGILASVLITGVVAWFAFGRETATRAEVDSVRNQIAADNQRFRDDLTAIRSKVDQMNGNLEAWLRLQRSDREGRLP